MSRNCSCEFSDNPCSSCLIANRDELIVTLQKNNDILRQQVLELTEESCCFRVAGEVVNVLHDEIQEDNDTLNIDLKEAEGAVADLMELNDTLTAEVDCGSDNILCPTHKKTGKACNKHLTISGKFLADELLKAEAERDRLRRLISEAIEATNPNIVDNLLFEAINPHQYALLQPEALNHKESPPKDKRYCCAARGWYNQPCTCNHKEK